MLFFCESYKGILHITKSYIKVSFVIIIYGQRGTPPRHISKESLGLFTQIHPNKQAPVIFRLLLIFAYTIQTC